jgi:hypothetical protein
VAAAGNVYRHEYEEVDDAIVCHTVGHDLSVLRQVAAAELQRIASLGK